MTKDDEARIMQMPGASWQKSAEHYVCKVCKISHCKYRKLSAAEQQVFVNHVLDLHLWHSQEKSSGK